MFCQVLAGYATDQAWGGKPDLPPGDDADLLALDIAALFVLTDSGRIRHDNAPDRSPGPRLYLGGCASANIVRIRHDVGPQTAAALERLAADEPPLSHPDSTPIHLDEYTRLLAAEAPVTNRTSGLTWHFPHSSPFSSAPSLRPEPRCGGEADPLVPGNFGHTLVSSATDTGDALLADLSQHGIPKPLKMLGFGSLSDFWPPWSVALQDGEIASIAFAARLSPSAAETGVLTVPEFRGRGLAAAATAGWAAHPDLRRRALFYSTSHTNVSSQRVAARLALRFLGASLSIS